MSAIHFFGPFDISIYTACNSVFAMTVSGSTLGESLQVHQRAGQTPHHDRCALGRACILVDGHKPRDGGASSQSIHLLEASNEQIRRCIEGRRPHLAGCITEAIRRGSNFSSRCSTNYAGVNEPAVIEAAAVALVNWLTNILIAYSFNLYGQAVVAHGGCCTCVGIKLSDACTDTATTCAVLPCRYTTTPCSAQPSKRR